VTLEPGVHEPDQAPWWAFTCPEADMHTIIVKQWMGEAAVVFAQLFANHMGGGKVESVKPSWLHVDGDYGQYELTMTGHPGELFYIIVKRGEMTTKPLEQ
jgi:hypothetical protein